jgi:acylphosphatase
VQAYVLRVSGRVQGVGFRWFAEREAVKRNIRGYVRNLEDGTVEILAQAEATDLEEFQERIRRGPAHARVTSVDLQPVEVDARLATFRVKT